MYVQLTYKYYISRGFYDYLYGDTQKKSSATANSYATVG